MEGKTVTVQLSLDAKGAIKNLQIVKGFEPSIDQRVIDFIKEYDAKKPLAESKLSHPTIVQMEIDLVSKKRYMN